MQLCEYLPVFIAENKQNQKTKEMKSIRTILILVFILASVSCIDGQFFRTVRGNGDVISKDRAASFFNGVKVSSGVDVELSQGDKESITVEADESLHDYIVTEVKNNVLHVYTDNVSIRDAEKKLVHVTIREVSSLKTSSAGDITGMTPLKGESIDLDASSAGDISIELNAKYVDIDISSSGNIRLSGEAEKINADLSSAGDLEAYDFVVREADVNASSAGNAKINVTEKLAARASSAGDILYRGNPKSVDARSSSAGGIRSR